MTEGAKAPSPRYTPEEIAANQARLRAKPDDAVLMEAPNDYIADGPGHRIPKGTLGWRHKGVARYDGPPMAGTSVMEQSYRWTCRDCARDKGWE